MSLTVEERLTRLEEQTLALCCPHTTKVSRITIVEVVQAIVCDELNVTKAAMLSDRRDAHLVLARHLGMTLAREFSGLSTPELAQLFNRLDHGTVLHASKMVSKALKTNRMKSAQHATIKARIVKALKTCE